MLKKFVKIIKKIIMSAFLLYAYNVMAQPLNLFIPINFLTVGLLSIFGIPALFMLIALLMILF